MPVRGYLAGGLLLLLFAGGVVFAVARWQLPESSASERVGYWTGPWWRGDINSTLLMPAHILVAFNGTAERDVDLRVPPGTRSSRSEEEAQRVARMVSKLARKDPNSFARLAKEYSDDPTTRDRGGRLGPTLAPRLPASVVDALGNLKYGEVSRVVRSRLGFHVIKRLRPPSEQTVSGEEIVVMYDGIEAPTRLDKVVPKRSRMEARKLALLIDGKARAKPEQFQRLVAQYSDAWSAVQGGDLGRWSTHEVFDGIVLDVLAATEVGQVGDLIDDPVWGFRIIRRTDPHRVVLSHSAVMIGFDAGSEKDWVEPSVTRTLDEARSTAELIVQDARHSPGAFDSYLNEYCDYGVCRLDPGAYESGRAAWLGLDKLLLQVQVGEVIEVPLETPMGFIVARRESPESHSVARWKVNFELPHPAPLRLEDLHFERVAEYIRVFQIQAAEELSLLPKERRVLKRALGRFEARLRAESPANRWESVRVLRNDLVVELGEDRARQLEALHHRLTGTLQGRLDPG